MLPGMTRTQAHSAPGSAAGHGLRAPAPGRRPHSHLARLVRLPRLQGADAQWPHHLVVLVLDDVAVPDELAGRVELYAQTRDLAGVGDDRILEAGLPGLGWNGHAAGG